VTRMSLLYYPMESFMQVMSRNVVDSIMYFLLTARTMAEPITWSGTPGTEGQSHWWGPKAENLRSIFRRVIYNTKEGQKVKDLSDSSPP